MGRFASPFAFPLGGETSGGSGYYGAYYGQATTSISDDDTNPPVITVVSPTPGVDPGDPGGFSADWLVARLTPVVVRIVDSAPGNSYQCLVARYAGSGNEIVVYRRGQFRGEFAARSSSSVITNGIELSILPAGGWPSSDEVVDMVLELDAIDLVGNISA